MGKLFDEIAQFVGRQARWCEFRGFVVSDVIGKAGMAGARTQGDLRLAMTDQNDAHGGMILGCKLSLSSGPARVKQPEAQFRSFSLFGSLAQRKGPAPNK